MATVHERSTQEEQPYDEIGGHAVALSTRFEIPELKQFIGRKRELELCRAAWGLTQDGKKFLEVDDNDLAGRMLQPLNFRLEGPPGVGKNEIVYQLARDLGRPLYIIQGHEELTPEDLALLLVPDVSRAGFRDAPLVLRASPLATALRVGGLFFFDEINRVPERALSPLASVLDSRGSLYSAMTGLHIRPSDGTKGEFRFCCALNPQLSEAGRGVLPEYIEERTLPAIRVDFLSPEDLSQLIQENLSPPPDFLQAFRSWYDSRSRKEVSIRQALTIVRYAQSLARHTGRSAAEAMQTADGLVPTGGTLDTDVEPAPVPEPKDEEGES